MEENPLRHGRRMNRSPEPCAMVIFGGSGDLTRRKLVPALYNLSRKRMIPGGFTILGISRSPMKDEEYRSRLREWVDKAEEAAPSDPETWEPFSQGIYYLPANFHDAAMYARLKEVLAAYDTRRGTGGNRIFYLATAPSDYVDIIRNLGSAGMAREDSGWVRAIIEKPFGRDLASARALNREVSAVFREGQGAAVHPALYSGGSGPGGGARPVRPRLRGGARDACVPRRTRGVAELDHRDVCGHPVHDRQLALGRRPILCAYGKKPCQARDRNRYSLPAHAAFDFPAGAH